MPRRYRRKDIEYVNEPPFRTVITEKEHGRPLLKHVEEGRIPIDPKLIGEVDPHFRGVYGGNWLDFVLKHGSMDPSLGFFYVPTQDIDSQTSDNPLENTGKDGILEEFVLGLPPNKRWSPIPPTGELDRIAKTSHLYVSSREQPLQHRFLSDSVTGQGIAPGPSAADALDTIGAGKPGCYEFPQGSGTYYRRVTWNISEKMNIGAYVVELIINRVASSGPPYSGEYYVTFNDEIDHQTGVSEATIGTAVYYPFPYGFAMRLSGFRIENITVHTKHQLSSYRLVAEAY